MFSKHESLSKTALMMNYRIKRRSRLCSAVARMASCLCLITPSIANAQSDNHVDGMGSSDLFPSALEFVLSPQNASTNQEIEKLHGQGATDAGTEYPSMSQIPAEVINDILYRMQSNEDAHAYLDKRFESIEITQRVIAESLEKISATVFEKLEKRLRKIEQSLSALSDQIAHAETDKNSVGNLSPPFDLVAIDSWQSKWNAVISFEGRLAMLEPGEFRSGWRLITIDPKKRTARFQNISTKDDIILEVSG